MAWRRVPSLRKLTPENEARRTADHEAAHAVIAHLYGARVVLLAVDRRDPRCGMTHVGWPTRRGRADVVAQAVMSMAGHEAEVRFWRRNIHWLPATDVRVCTHQLRCGSMSVDTAGYVARRLVSIYRHKIRWVAQALVQTPTWRLDRRGFLAAMRAYDQHLRRRRARG